MDFRFLIVLFLFSQPSFANYSGRYYAASTADTAAAQNLGTRIRNRDASLCALKAVPFHSSCFRQYVKRNPIRSTLHLGALTRIASAMALYDVQGGADKNSEVLDNMITVLEQVRLDEFHLKKDMPTDELELQENAELRVSDNLHLRSFRQNVSATIERAIGLLPPGARTDQLRSRWTKFKTVVWTYADEKREPVVAPKSLVALPPPNVSASQESWCTEPSVTKCFKLDIIQCGVRFRNALSQCGGKADCAIGKWIRGAQVESLMKPDSECRDTFMPYVTK